MIAIFNPSSMYHKRKAESFVYADVRLSDDLVLGDTSSVDSGLAGVSAASPHAIRTRPRHAHHRPGEGRGREANRQALGVRVRDGAGIQLGR